MNRLTRIIVTFLTVITVFTSCNEDVIIEAPEVVAGENIKIEENKEVLLNANLLSEVDASLLSFEWVVPEGVTAEKTDSIQLSFIAPKVIEDTDFSFRIIVRSSDIDSTYDDITVTVLQTDNSYFINYGNYGGEGSSITVLNNETGEVVNNYFQNQNDGIELTSNIQYAYEYKDSIYLMGNDADQIITVNSLFQQTQASTTTDVEKPRFCIGNEEFLYVSCWGADADFNLMPGSYIAKFNTTTNSVDKKIALPGGPEGLAIANGNLYVALNYVDSVAVINLETEAISYIVTPAVPSYFLKDASDNLYVSLVSTYSDFSTETGLGYINTTSNSLEQTYILDGVSSGYSSIISANTDFSKIYTLASAWVEETAGNWIQKGAVFSFDVATGEFTSFADGLTGTNGVVSDPVTNDVYVLTSSSATEGGVIKVYSEDGTFVKDLTSGVSPYWALFLE